MLILRGQSLLQYLIFRSIHDEFSARTHLRLIMVVECWQAVSVYLSFSQLFSLRTFGRRLDFGHRPNHPEYFLSFFSQLRIVIYLVSFGTSSSQHARSLCGRLGTLECLTTVFGLRFECSLSWLNSSHSGARRRTYYVVLAKFTEINIDHRNLFLSLFLLPFAFVKHPVQRSGDNRSHCFMWR